MIDALVLSGSYDVGLVPDPHGAGAGPLLDPRAPGRYVLALAIAGVAVQVVHRFPILDHDDGAGADGLEPEQATLGVATELAQHA